jgi:hypothetical protein
MNTTSTIDVDAVLDNMRLEMSNGSTVSPGDFVLMSRTLVAYSAAPQIVLYRVLDVLPTDNTRKLRVEKISKTFKEDELLPKDEMQGLFSRKYLKRFPVGLEEMPEDIKNLSPEYLREILDIDNDEIDSVSVDDKVYDFTGNAIFKGDVVYYATVKGLRIGKVVRHHEKERWIVKDIPYHSTIRKDIAYFESYALSLYPFADDKTRQRFREMSVTELTSKLRDKASVSWDAAESIKMRNMSSFFSIRSD